MSRDDKDYKRKYLKYKLKYNQANNKIQTGGNLELEAFTTDHTDHVVGYFNIYGKEFKFINYGKELVSTYSTNQYINQPVLFSSILDTVTSTKNLEDHEIEDLFKRFLNNDKYEINDIHHDVVHDDNFYFCEFKLLYSLYLIFIYSTSNCNELRSSVNNEWNKLCNEFKEKYKNCKQMNENDYIKFRTELNKIIENTLAIDDEPFKKICNNYIDILSYHIMEHDNKNKKYANSDTFIIVSFKPLQLKDILIEYLGLLTGINIISNANNRINISNMIKNRYVNFIYEYYNFVNLKNKYKPKKGSTPKINKSIAKFFSIFLNFIINRQLFSGFNLDVKKINGYIQSLKEANNSNIVAMEVPDYFPNHREQLGNEYIAIANSHNIIISEYAKSEIVINNDNVDYKVDMYVYHGKSTPDIKSPTEISNIIKEIVKKDTNFFIFMDTNITMKKCAGFISQKEKTEYTRGTDWLIDKHLKTDDKLKDLRYFVGNVKIKKSRPLQAYLNEQITKIDIETEYDGMLYITNIPKEYLMIDETKYKMIKGEQVQVVEYTEKLLPQIK
jgi:hypothetical protein